MRATEFINSGTSFKNELVSKILLAVPTATEIWFYGSRARGDNRVDSDWDILVIVPDDVFFVDSDIGKRLDDISKNYENFDIQAAPLSRNPQIVSARQHGKRLWPSPSQNTTTKINEIQRRPDDPGVLDYSKADIDSNIRSRIKMISGSDRFGYIAGVGVTFFTGADYIIELFDLKPPTGGEKLVGYLALSSAEHFPLPKSYRVANAGIDKEYRGQVLGQTLYIIALKLLGMTILADDTQTASARKMWARLVRTPGVEISGYTSVSPRSWAQRGNPDKIDDWDDLDKIKALLRVGGGEIGGDQHSTYIAFPVTTDVGRGELASLRKVLNIYSARHPEEGGTDNGLFARWRGQ
jgi:hypothetical protein